MDLSHYAAATLHEDSEFVLCRGRAPASPTPHRPSVRGSIHRSEHPGRRPRQQLCSAATLSGARALVVCLLVVIDSLDLLAPSASTGALTGTVTDPPRAVVQNAQITLRSNGTLGRVIARETIETLPLVAMTMNPRIMQFGLKLEF